ncbi:hypothetical protein [Curtobacterium sp. Curtsp57]|uniref:hypothetical protein n=1 Tax=Curtobacterium sp. Curtsp57 TaxID=3243047 RepID=UPI0039B4C69E
MSLHLSTDRILWGHVLLEDTDNPDAHLAQILVRPIDTEPGYELYDPTNTVLPNLTVPAVREANRIVQTLLIPASETARREKAVRAVIHSGYLEGAPDNMPWQTQLWMFARGETTLDQVHAYADTTTSRQEPRASEAEPAASADVPEAWWQETQARIRRHLYDTTRTVAETAAALQIDEDDVRGLLRSQRLMALVIDGEERIPDWQLLEPALPEFGDPSVLLPGLDVLYAAAPDPLLDAAAMTEFMTAPRDTLTLDRQPSTPLVWIQQGRPLATVIALFRGRKWRQ